MFVGLTGVTEDAVDVVDDVRRRSEHVVEECFPKWAGGVDVKPFDSACLEHVVGWSSIPQLAGA